MLLLTFLTLIGLTQASAVKAALESLHPVESVDYSLTEEEQFKESISKAKQLSKIIKEASDKDIKENYINELTEMSKFLIRRIADYDSSTLASLSGELTENEKKLVNSVRFEFLALAFTIESRIGDHHLVHKRTGFYLFRNKTGSYAH